MWGPRPEPETVPISRFRCAAYVLWAEILPTGYPGDVKLVPLPPPRQGADTETEQDPCSVEDSVRPVGVDTPSTHTQFDTLDSSVSQFLITFHYVKKKRGTLSEEDNGYDLMSLR